MECPGAVVGLAQNVPRVIRAKGYLGGGIGGDGGGVKGVVVGWDLRGGVGLCIEINMSIVNIDKFIKILKSIVCAL